jgi:hypothetical protein
MGLKVSLREMAMIKVAEFIEDNRLNRVYSGDGYGADKKYRYVVFNVPRNLDGEVRIYNKNFVYVSYQTRYLDLPHKDRRIFKNVDDAIEFLRLAFVELKFDEAMNVPLK